MRKLLFASLYALVVAGFGFAIAQNLNRSIQLNQSPLGPINVDSVNGVYFPDKVNTSGSAPTISSFGTGAVISGSDTAGEITLGTSPGTGGTLTFRTAYTSTPYCVPGGSTAASPPGITITSPNGMNFSHSATSGGKFQYICIGRSTG